MYLQGYDLNSIQKTLDNLLSENELQNLWTNFSNAFYNNDSNKNELYDSFIKEIDQIKETYPYLSRTIDEYVNYLYIDFNSNGKGISFGKVSTEDGLDINMNALFRMGLKGGTNIVDIPNTDLNNYLTDGLYYFSGSFTPKNIPVGTDGWLQVITNGIGTVIKHIWYQQGTVSSNWGTYTRTKCNNNSVWSSWGKLVIPSDVWKGGTGGGLLQTVSVNLGSRTINPNAGITLTQTYTIPTGYSAIGIIGVNAASTGLVLVRYGVAGDTVLIPINNTSSNIVSTALDKNISSTSSSGTSGAYDTFVSELKFKTKLKI